MGSQTGNKGKKERGRKKERKPFKIFASFRASSFVYSISVLGQTKRFLPGFLPALA